MTTASATYNIPEGRIDEMHSRVARLAKKAAKLGLPGPSISIGEVTERPIIGPDGLALTTYLGKRIMRRWVEVEVANPVPTLPDWRFLGTVQHTPAGNILRTFTDEHDLTRFRKAAPTCDHCKTSRRRKDTYLVVKEGQKKIRRVGSTCLQDYLGHDCLAALTHAGRVYGYGDLEDTPVGSYERDSFPIEEVLAVIATVIRRVGWTPRKDHDPASGKIATADVALACLQRPEEAAKEYPEVFEKGPAKKDGDAARGALKFARAIPEDVRSQYLSNLRVACSLDYTGPREVGLVASAVIAYQRDKERKLAAKRARKAAAGLKGHLGSPGDKVGRTLSRKDVAAGKAAHPAQVGDVTGLRTFEGHYGLTTVVKITTNTGYALTWFATTDVEADIGDTVRVVGTIKKHGEFRGVKETVLTRCQIERA